ncbi:hypothetical protein Tco_0367569 [Tanacetum coccineum]
MSSRNSFNSSKQPISLPTMENLLIRRRKYEIWAMENGVLDTLMLIIIFGGLLRIREQSTVVGKRCEGNSNCIFGWQEEGLHKGLWQVSEDYVTVVSSAGMARNDDLNLKFLSELPFYRGHRNLMSEIGLSYCVKAAAAIIILLSLECTMLWLKAYLLLISRIKDMIYEVLTSCLIRLENKTGEVEKVYGMMAGLHTDNGGAGVSDAAAEFALMGISPKAGEMHEFLTSITGNVAHSHKVLHRGNTAASVPAGSRNSSASVTAGGSDPAAAHLAAAQSNPAGWSKRPAPVSAGRPVSAGLFDLMIYEWGRWVCCLRPQQVKEALFKFGGGDGRISRKALKTSKLDFEYVYYEEFQLPDESQVVLRIPREHDLYTFSISELQPEQNVTFLVGLHTSNGPGVYGTLCRLAEELAKLPDKT